MNGDAVNLQARVHQVRQLVFNALAELDKLEAELIAAWTPPVNACGRDGKGA